MGQDMEHVTHCHTEDDGADTEGEERELPFDEIHHRQAEERAEDYRKEEQRQCVPVTIADEDEEHDEYERAKKRRC